MGEKGKQSSARVGAECGPGERVGSLKEFRERKKKLGSEHGGRGSEQKMPTVKVKGEKSKRKVPTAI